jgi:leucyl-tRNA synthetase
VFHDIGLVSRPEPFRKLFNQGMLTAPAYRDSGGRWRPADEVVADGDGWVHGPSGERVEQVVAAMGKSLRNVVNPDDVIAEHGADAFRLYELFMAPLGDGRTWDTQGISGCRRFLDRLWKLFVDPGGDAPIREELRSGAPPQARSGDALELERHLNRAIRRVDDSFDGFNFNTGIAALMTFVNEAVKRPGALARDQADRLVRTLAPFAPHVAEELWQRLGHAESVAAAAWPEADPAFLEDDDFELVVQVQGRVRGRTRAPRDASEDDLAALARGVVATHLQGKRLVKTVVVRGRLVNFVVR